LGDCESGLVIASRSWRRTPRRQTGAAARWRRRSAARSRGSGRCVSQRQAAQGPGCTR
jgi:hypothetical protein